MWDEKTSPSNQKHLVTDDDDDDFIVQTPPEQISIEQAKLQLRVFIENFTLISQLLSAKPDDLSARRKFEELIISAENGNIRDVIRYVNNFATDLSLSGFISHEITDNPIRAIENILANTENIFTSSLIALEAQEVIYILNGLINRVTSTKMSIKDLISSIALHPKWGDVRITCTIEAKIVQDIDDLANLECDYELQMLLCLIYEGLRNSYKFVKDRRQLSIMIDQNINKLVILLEDNSSTIERLHYAPTGGTGQRLIDTATERGIVVRRETKSDGSTRLKINHFLRKPEP